MITCKSRQEIEAMRKAGQIVAEVHDLIQAAIRPGISTAELDALAEEHIRRRNGVPAFKGYYGYPANVCVSINEEVVHGIPGPRKLEEGDIVGVDVGVILDGFYGDGARTYAVGKISPTAERLLTVTEEALALGIKKALPGARLTDIGHAIQSHVEANGFSVVREFVGHGIGRAMHEDPQVPNFGEPGHGPRLRVGMTLAIEPMVNAGDWKVKVLDDLWTVVTVDGSLSAHFEHTIAVTEDGPDVLTVV